MLYEVYIIKCFLAQIIRVKYRAALFRAIFPAGRPKMRFVLFVWRNKLAPIDAGFDEVVAQ